VLENKEVLNKTTGLRSRKLYFSQSYNKVERHDFEIEDYVDQVSSSVDYAFSFQPKPIEPFKNKFMKKSYWKLLSDFNFNYLPSNVSFNIITDNTIVSNLDK
jgi:cell surface protein SprA